MHEMQTIVITDPSILFGVETLGNPRNAALYGGSMQHWSLVTDARRK